MVELVTHHWAEIFTSRKMASGSHVRLADLGASCSEGPQSALSYQVCFRPFADIIRICNRSGGLCKADIFQQVT